MWDSIPSLFLMPRSRSIPVWHQKNISTNKPLHQLSILPIHPISRNAANMSEIRNSDDWGLSPLYISIIQQPYGGSMKTSLNLITIFALSFSITPLWASIIRVPWDQPTIQSGINAASNGDTVVIYPGLYYENIIFRGKNIVITSRFYETGDLSFIH